MYQPNVSKGFRSDSLQRTTPCWRSRARHWFVLVRRTCAGCFATRFPAHYRVGVVALIIGLIYSPAKSLADAEGWYERCVQLVCERQEDTTCGPRVLSSTSYRMSFGVYPRVVGGGWLARRRFFQSAEGEVCM